MGDRTGIEWAAATWNPIRARNRATGKVGWHCEHVGEACRFCYAESWNRARGTGLAYKPGHRDDIEIFLDERMLLQPLRWRRPRTIFPGSMTDLFGPFVPDAWLDRIFAVMALCPRHTFTPLTKWSGRMRSYLAQHRTARIAEALFKMGLVGYSAPWPLPNVEAGVTAEDQAAANERVPDLLATPAAKRWVSAEPLLGRIDFTRIPCPNRCQPPDYCNRCYPDGGVPTGTFDALSTGAIDRIVVGGESGPKARPMHRDWVHEIFEQCSAAGCEFFFKQWGEWISASELRYLPGGSGPGFGIYDHCRHDVEADAVRVGRKAAGRTLDGVIHGTKPGAAA